MNRTTLHMHQFYFSPLVDEVVAPFAAIRLKNTLLRFSSTEAIKAVCDDVRLIEND